MLANNSAAPWFGIVSSCLRRTFLLRRCCQRREKKHTTSVKPNTPPTIATILFPDLDAVYLAAPPTAATRWTTAWQLSPSPVARVGG